MKAIFDDYTKCYSLSKTLRFSLIPQGSTAENIKRYGIVEEDSLKNENYYLAKPLLDKCHKEFIDRVLEELSFDWEPLYKALKTYQRDKSSQNEEFLQTEQDSIKKQISDSMRKHSLYKSLEPKDLISSAKSILDGKKTTNSLIEILETEEKEIIAKFDKFTTYFTGYKQTRENIYIADKATSIANRLVNVNFPKFVADIEMYNSLSDELKCEFFSSLEPLFGGYSPEEVFSINFYNRIMSQAGISMFNTLLGGISEDGNVKGQGLNELCNLAFQSGKIGRKIKFNLLFKQILSDSIKSSFSFEPFEDEKELLCAVKEYSDLLFSSETKVLTDSFFLILTNSGIDKEKIYIDKKQITFLSQLIFDDWSKITSSLKEAKIKDKKIYTLSEIESCTDFDILSNIKSSFASSLMELSKTQEQAKPVFWQTKINSYTELKAYLDTIQKCEKILKIFAAGDELDKDSVFYSDFDVLYSVFRDNIGIYNKVRNFATKKPYSTEKFKLNFKNPTLANGWDQNKETANNALLFEKDGLYYIGIYNAEKKKRIAENTEKTDGCYRKMIYKLLPGPNKMLPKVFFSKTGIETYGQNDYILEGYYAGKHKKGSEFDIDFCHDLIDYFKACIKKHPDWSKFNFKFSETSSYKDISEFYNEISKQNYKVTFSFVSENDMNEAVENGNLFLFQLYNKDFSPNSTGKANLHTLYWKELFSEENLKSPVLKLNGEAELFYRPKSIENPFIHKDGSVLINKKDRNNNVVDDKVYETALNDVKAGLGIADLESKHPDLKFRLAPHSITKDKRFAKPSFAFHVPITLNYGVDNKYKNLNLAVIDTIGNNPEVNIIGIDRGERNLLYISCIDRNGNIIEQKSLNIIGGFNYLQKLTHIAKDRDEQRKNWKSVSAIKDIKNGYLSVAVHEVTEMMLRNNAILVLEDLSGSFKRTRVHIEHQIYQNFERMLIEKLNYLVDKSKTPYEFGGISNAYQLANKFESFQKLGKQSGFIFYVPASYTSKIDFKTGFVNLFTSEQLKYRSVESSRAFFNAFKDISYNAEGDYFEFSFNYSDFKLYKTDYTDNWTVCTYGNERISFNPKNGSHGEYEYVNVTEKLKELFLKHEIDYTSSLKEKIVSQDEKSFFSTLIWLFKLTVALRYEDKENDFILSPIKNIDGYFYDTRAERENEPKDGDGNGAYHIALQGLRLIIERIENGKVKSDEKGMQAYNWFRFAQKKSFKN